MKEVIGYRRLLGYAMFATIVLALIMLALNTLAAD